MNEFFKNPWAWLLILFLTVSGGMGMFLFRGSSAKVVESDASAMSAESLSKEDSEGIVRELESGNVAPGESESDNESDDGAENNASDEPTTVSPTVPSEESPSMQMKSTEPVKHAEDSAMVSETSKSSGKFSIENRLVSWGFSKSSGRKIDTVVIHSTYNATGGDLFSVSKIIDIYKSYGVSPHYLVARDGTVYRMVEEKNIAYHAGDSEMPDGRKNVNAFSIGIEVIGKDDGGPSDAQYDALKKLLADIETRQTIKHILGHSDIAPGRKSDPWGFNWKKIGGKDL